MRRMQGPGHPEKGQQEGAAPSAQVALSRTEFQPSQLWDRSGETVKGNPIHSSPSHMGNKTGSQIGLNQETVGLLFHLTSPHWLLPQEMREGVQVRSTSCGKGAGSRSQCAP